MRLWLRAVLFCVVEMAALIVLLVGSAVLWSVFVPLGLVFLGVGYGLFIGITEKAINRWL